MWEQILVGVIVVVAVVYLIRRIRGAISGRCACEENMCAGCSMKGGCGYAAKGASSCDDDE